MPREIVPSFRARGLLAFIVALSATTLTATSSVTASPTWSVLSDFTATSTPTSQMRSMRGLALSSDDSKLFAGFIQGTSSSGLRKIDSTTGGVDSTVTIAASRQPNAMATDDRGYVYAAASVPSTAASPDGRFGVYDSNLVAIGSLTNPGGTQRLAGLSVQQVGLSYYLYLAREATSSALIQRYDVTNAAAPVLDTTFGVGGSFDVRGFYPAAFNLTGLEVANDGTIFATSRDQNLVYKFSADLLTTSSVTITRAMDIALYGNELYVSNYNGSSSAISVLEQSDLSVVGTLTTGIARDNVTDSGYAGIDISSDGRIFLVDQIYKNTPSTSFQDRVLVSTAVPEPSFLALLSLLPLALRRRRA
jgi:hypothetical protein